MGGDDAEQGSKRRVPGAAAVEAEDEFIKVATTLLQPRKSHVHRSAKKQLRISGRMTSLSGLSVTQVRRVWNHASCSEEIGPVVCRRSPQWELAYFAVVAEAHRFSVQCAYLAEKLFTKDLISSMKNSAGGCAWLPAPACARQRSRAPASSPWCCTACWPTGRASSPTKLR
jgi:hypothetical protein